MSSSSARKQTATAHPGEGGRPPDRNEIEAAAVDYIARGWSVFPVPPGSKKSCKSAQHSDGRRWGATTDPMEVRCDWRRWPDANVGICTGAISGFFVVEADTVDGHDVDGIGTLASLVDAHGRLPRTIEAVSPSGSRHLYFRWPEGGAISNSTSKAGLGIDVRGDGGMVVAPPSIKPGKGPYRWVVSPSDAELAECPDWLLDRIRTSTAPSSRQRKHREAHHSAEGEEALRPGDLDRVRRRLRSVENQLERDAWVKLALGLKSVFGDALREDFIEYSYRWPCETGDPERVWATCRPDGRLRIGTVFWLLGGGADLTEDDVAMVFTDRHGEAMRFDHDAGRWYEWTGDRWQQDATGIAYNRCREIARELSDDVEPKVKAIVRKAAFASGVERMARSDRVHAVTQSVWDGDPLALGVPRGMVDLRTGRLLPPDPADMLTKQTAVAPSRAGCPRWLTFLHETTAGDEAMVRFLQQWCGYSLTGDTREHALLFVYGPGGNGKSVFLETVAHILADYAQTASMDTFTASQSDRHPTDMAMLRGARLVTASETEEGRAWAESRIKQLTGGDQIAARFMRQDFFVFTPQFKLTVVGNHKPVLKNVDDAARRRFNIVPFTVKPAQPDRTLTEKLKAEAPGILQWMIDGCLDWQRNGLVRPQKVLDATAEYFDAQDVLGQWLETSCRVEPGNQLLVATSAALFESWTAYATAVGEKPGLQRGLSNSLEKQGLTSGRERVAGGTRARVWYGIELHPRKREEVWP